MLFPRPARHQDRSRRDPGAAVAQQRRSAVTGSPALPDPTHVKCDNSRGNQEYTKRRLIIIATGTKPAVSPKVPINGRNIINSDQILQMPEIPRTLIVVGGGVIGVEYTCMFATLGVRVILVEKRPAPARIRRLRDGGSVLLPSARQPRHHAAERRSGERGRIIRPAEWSPICKARRRSRATRCFTPSAAQGNVDELNLAAAGIEADARGRIQVDADFQHQVSRNIYAVGDVIGFPSLASVSMEQGRIAAAQRLRRSQLALQPRHLPVRHLYHPGDLVHRQDGRAA